MLYTKPSPLISLLPFTLQDYQSLYIDTYIYEIKSDLVINISTFLIFFSQAFWFFRLIRSKKRSGITNCHSCFLCNISNYL